MSDIETAQDLDEGGSKDTQPDRGFTMRIVLSELLLVVLIFVGVAAIVRGASAADPDDSGKAATPATISLSAMPETTADIYRYAADHLAHFVELPCYCGCEKSLGHHNLEDCFVNPAGWDPHAAGCGVCTAEAVAARDQLATGIAISEVRQSIIDRFGPPPAA